MPISMNTTESRNYLQLNQQGMFVFTCRVLRRRKNGRKTAHEMPISRLDLAETATDLPVCSEHVVLPQKDEGVIALVRTRQGSVLV
jgi:hypothetical protein